MKYLVVLALLIPLTSLAGGYEHHKPPKPVIIDKTKTVVIDKTVTVQETIDNTVTNEYFNTIDNTVTEQYYNTIDQTITNYYENVFDDNRLVAGVAMAGIHYPTPYRSNKDTFVSVAANFYRNAQAFGIALQHLPTDDMALFIDYRFNGKDQTDGMVGAGASFGF